MSNYDNGDNSFFVGLFSGVLASLVLCILLLRITEVDISDEELYRFCIERKIELENCKIPKNPVAENNKKDGNNND